jgi:hypothetical protein
MSYLYLFEVRNGIMFVSDLRQFGGFLRVIRFPPPQYNLNIVESGAKHHFKT